ncbi:hypothetical protein [Prosthecochloris sp. SCSIO W1103]|uniref:hypothetical protein n=1 Tax=Prosthecochloris sp. SCSIO W1103 TaxID=2992244 RepID=UPI00223D630F|nr:hypothetical protein [Prosthecochloris sp. SCSIO W1103]UZJ37337.1 hypothetical protein OO005_11380 [Prosthecochloris sp. SCSIO W1103]
MVNFAVDAGMEVLKATPGGEWLIENTIDKAAQNPVVVGAVLGGFTGHGFGMLGGIFQPITVPVGTACGVLIGGAAGGGYMLYEKYSRSPSYMNGKDALEAATKGSYSIANNPYFSFEQSLFSRYGYQSKDYFKDNGISSAGNVFDGNHLQVSEIDYNRDLENELVDLKQDNERASVSVDKHLNPNVKAFTKSVEQFDEVINKQDQAAKYIYGQFGLDESGMPLGGLPKREDFLVGGQMLSVTESEKESIEGIQGGIKKQIDVLNNVADGLDMVGYDLKGVGNFATTIEQLTLASKLDHPDFDKTKAYVAGISSLFKGIGANIGGNVGSALSSMGNMAASGASIGSAIAPGGTGAVVGAVVGGAVGLISSIFGGDDEDEQEEAARERMRQQIYQGMLSRSLSGSGPYSLKMLRESNWDYGKLKKQFGNKDEEELIKYQNRLELLDDIGASLEQIGSPEIVRSIDQVRAKYEYAAKSVKGMLDIASAEMTEISAQVFGLTADNLVSMFDSAIETAEDAGHAGRLIAEALELQIVDSFKKLAISQAINEAVMPMLQPILNELVAGALSGGLSPGEMADLVLQAQEIAASVAPAVSSLYGAFDEAGVLNYSYSSTPFESQGSYNRPVITGGTGVASGQQNDTRGDRPVQVVVQVANHEFETMVTELADNVFVKAERRKGVVNAQKVFG